MYHNHQANGKDWLIVDVPKGYLFVDFFVDEHSGQLVGVTINREYAIRGNLFNYSVHCLSSKATEEEAAQMVDRITYMDMYSNGYLFKDYINGGYRFYKPLESMRSLLQSLNIDNAVILKKK